MTGHHGDIVASELLGVVHNLLEVQGVDYAKELVLNLCSHHKTDLHVYSSKYSNQWDNLTEVYSPLPTINENTFKNQTDSNIFSFSLLINTLHEIMIERKKNNQPDMILLLELLTVIRIQFSKKGLLKMIL
jgi:hypothetical protein